MFVFFISPRNLGKFSIFSAFFSSFAEKEKIRIFTFIRCSVVNFEYAASGFGPGGPILGGSKSARTPALLQKKVYGSDRFHGNGFAAKS